MKNFLTQYGLNTFRYLFATIITFLFLETTLYCQPTGFVDQEYMTGWNQAVGMTFDINGRMFVWEKGGKVWIVENGIKSSSPLIDISEEVGNWRDFGFLGFALDPDFLSNGYIYLLYLVDRHHLLHFGTGSYNSNSDEYFNATIGRITRYTAEQSTNFTTVDYSSRKILLGATKETGFPSLHESHGIGSLVFGTDGTLMVSLGDGASYGSVDEGSASETYWSQAISDGIISAADNIGAYRCQKLTSLNGKILRIDPDTGAGIPSNPYYESGDPFSVKSRVWALGARNPFRMTKRPDTGSHLSGDGDPGVFYFGDVGWGTREELNIIKQPGENFGWPKYEGMTYQPGYNNATYAPSSHTLAAVDWRTASADPRMSINGTIYNLGDPGVELFDFIGNCSTGGVWVINGNYPSEYKDVYYHGDYGDDWIHAFQFDENDNFVKAIPFADDKGSIVFLATHPTDGELYYIRYGNAIHKFTYDPTGNQPPMAVASADVIFGPGPLTVQFTGDQSTDPENGTLTYDWDFGNGPESTEANPQYIFTAPPGTPTEFTVRLTVMDDGSLIDETTLTISVNNTPPVITATSIDNIDEYSMSGTTLLNLSATVTDAEHSSGEIEYEWQTFLHHDNHNHAETPDNNPSTTTSISPIGCDGVSYYYKITLKVTDAAGLSGYFEKDIYPDCGGPIAVNDSGIFPGIGSSSEIDILANDQGSIDPASVQIVSDPSYGNLSVNSSDGIVTYTRVSSGISDSFNYTVDDNSGNTSNVASVIIDQTGPPAVAILSPADGSNIGSADIDVTYELSGDWEDQNVDRLLVTLDGQAPYEELGTSGSFSLSGLSVGNHTIIIQLYAGSTPLTNLEATASVTFSRISLGGGTGLQANYFDDMNLTDPPDLVRIDPTIDFNWANGSPDPSIGSNTFSARWEGQVQAIYNEHYTFQARVDDGVRLYIDGQLIIDEWTNGAARDFNGSIQLISGKKHSLVMEYYEDGGRALAKLKWFSASQSIQIIPSNYLFPPAIDLYSRTSGDWSSALTWSEESLDGSQCSCTPDDNTNVIIGNNHDLILNEIGNVRNLTIQDNATLHSPASYDLNISGNLTITSSNVDPFSLGSQAISLIGSDDQILALNNEDLFDLIINKAAGKVLLTEPLNLLGTLNFLTPNELVSDGNLTLISTTDGVTDNGSIGTILSGAPVTGDVTVQRFISDEGNIWRYISSPVTNATIADWQDDFPITGNFDDPSTGPGINSGTPSVYYYGESGSGIDKQLGWLAYPSSGLAENSPLIPGTGYSALMLDGSNPTMVEVTGPINQGDFSFFVSYAGSGWNLLGNPYPATIDWGNASGWSRTNVANAIYIRNNEAGNSNSVVASFVDGIGTNGGTGLVATGQSFWVQALDVDPSLQINERAKSSSTGVFFRNHDPVSMFRITLSSEHQTDEAVVRFSERASFGYDPEMDAKKFSQGSINLSTNVESQDNMAINSIPTLTCAQTVRVKLNNTKPGNYRLSFTELSRLNLPYDIELIDNYSESAMQVLDNSIYQFNVTSDTATYKNRFTLSVLPEELAIKSVIHGHTCSAGQVELAATANYSELPGLQYNWYQDSHSETPLEVNNSGKFVTPELTSSKSYFVSVTNTTGCESKKVEVTATIEQFNAPEIIQHGQNILGSNYKSGNQWYHNGIPILNANREVITITKPGVYGLEVKVSECQFYQEKEIHPADLSTGFNSLIVYPSPAENLLNLSLPPIEDQKASIMIYNTLGKLVFSTPVEISKRKAQIDISQINPGVYILEVYIDKHKYTTRFIK